MPKSSLALIVLTIWVSSNAISHAAEPWPNTSCERLAKNIMTATGIPVSISIEKIVSDYQGDIIPDGYACMVKGRASGINQSWSKGYARTRAISNGWTDIVEVEADSAMSSTWGFRKGNQELIMHLDSDPPEACADGPAHYCKAPRKLWIWNIKAMAYQR